MEDPLAAAAVAAIHAGDLPALRTLLDQNPELAKMRLGGCEHDPAEMSRTLLHVVSDRPGHFRNGAATFAALVAAGAEVNARLAGPHTETRLYWAISSNDVEVLDALLDAGLTSKLPARSSPAALRWRTP